MYFDSFTDFLAMGGHALYVWMSYGAFVLVMIWIILDLGLNRKSNLEKARRVWARETSRSGSGKNPVEQTGGEL